MKSSISISYHFSPYFRYNLLIVCGGNSFKHVIKYNKELRGDGPSMKVKYDIHNGRVEMPEPKEDPVMAAGCPFVDIRPPFMEIGF